MHEFVEKLCCIKEDLADCFKSELSMNMQNMDCGEAGEVVDMIKDLCKAEKDCYKAMYYKSIVEAMENPTPEDYERWGYNPNRNASTGRYTRGYPIHEMEPMYNRMGYSGGESPRYGKAYRDYQMAKRNYTSSQTMQDREEMKTHASEHLSDTMMTIKDIWMDSDPDLKRKIKHDLTQLVQDLDV